MNVRLSAVIGVVVVLWALVIVVMLELALAVTA